jgi:hypothetical protein
MHEKRDFGPLRLQRGKSSEIIVPDPEQTVKTVCGVCNNGWMSALESANIPIIGCMFDDISIPLDREQQTLVAAWSTKTAMVLDSTRPRAINTRFYEKEECVKMRESRTIPDRTRVWLGRLDSSHLNASGTDFTITTIDGTLVGNGSVATIVAGHFVVQIVTQHVLPEFRDKGIPDVEPKPGNWTNVLIPIWPIEREWVTWHPAISFTNGGPGGIAYLMDRWRMGRPV